MQVSARTDYGLRAMAELAARTHPGGTELVRAEDLAGAQRIPAKFLESILTQLRRAGLVVSKRGAEGGYRLARDPRQISVADVVRAIDGPLAAVRGEPPEDAEYVGPAAGLLEVWIAVRAALREVLENVTLADVVAHELPQVAARMLDLPGAWERRW
ncbi:MAG: RrF2 family transcriptional regulator [Candidatus Nanopelagicales bacterium]